ncbi:response regulator transcription factor [Miltoncostaea marina]|uniref:response regulator transcription factor n=1 Tax=Miltoncostaea marina TaxID=2843215 RepID=UPI001C3C8A07|nr:response regulator transcription factor [Miltoncostaea marina]
MSPSILVVDDEPGIIELASAYLRRDGFTVRTARTGRRALDALATQPADLVVLDLMLPDIAGEEVCASLRRHSAVPILMLTAKSAEADRLRGLALGADDYLVKPFSPRELVARVRAILRRSGGRGQPAADLLVIDGGRLEVDLAAHEARLNGAALALTVAEFRLLAALARQPRRVFSRYDLLQAVQGPDVEGIERTVDVHVMRLRKKMDEALPGAAGYVATVYGVGYRLEESV